MHAELWPLAVYAGLAGIVVAGMLGLSALLGGRRSLRSTSLPYESGIQSHGGARVRLGIKYFRVALFFVVFDLEVAFLVAWALAARQLGWPGYIGMLVFVGILALSLAYLWRLGALDWGTSARTRGAPKVEGPNLDDPARAGGLRP
jgi:NADH-quinone oxidoreductase subunit A